MRSPARWSMRSQWAPNRAVRRSLHVALLLTLVGALHAGLSPSTQSPGLAAVVAPRVTVASALITRHEDEGAPAALPTAPLALDALSPELAAYVATQAPTMGIVVYDLTHDRSYSYNGATPFTLASSAKVYILCAYLDWLERLGRSATSLERAQLSVMITRSDNDAAHWLFDRMGGAAAQEAFFARVGIAGYVPYGRWWGWGRLSPAAMVQMLTLLETGQVLSPTDRAFAFGLLGHIEVGRWGVGDTAAREATVFMKDGWVTGPDHLWAQNSSGIVRAGDETYIISVYSQHLPRYDWSKTQRVCAMVARVLG